ncbi:MAG: SDR family oxidoreductase [bacterium]|nr:SDR family oxidoreductase [bacterium]
MRDWLKDLFRDRPVWINALMIFSSFMAFLYMPWDIFWKPVAEDQEVWFGIMFTGWWAKLAAIPHWLVYGAAIHGFRRRRPWICSWGALYTAQISLGMLVWSINVFESSLLGILFGLISAAPFALLTLALVDAREHFSEVHKPMRARYGEWALVTGASAGLGVEFARALAREGMSCVLAARREDRMEELADELEKRHRIETRVVAVDLAAADGADKLAEACADLEIGVLVNNAGLGYAGRFDKQETNRLRDLVAVNCTAPVVLTSKIAPGMVERGRGAVIFTGSVAGRQPMPLHSLYSATKAFDRLLAESLYVELRDHGVDVLVLEPGSTETEFQEVAGEIPHTGQSAEEVVAIAMAAVGEQPAVVSGWWNWIRAIVPARIMPRSLVAYIARDVVKQQTPIEMR